MEERIRAYVTRACGADDFTMRYRNPVTGRTVQQSAGTAERKEAERSRIRQ